MPDRTLKVPRNVRDVIRQLHPELKRKVREALTDLLADPGVGKALKGDLDGYWSLRVGRHRLIYRPDSEGAEIIAFGPRRTIYDDMSKRSGEASESDVGDARKARNAGRTSLCSGSEAVASRCP